MNALFEFSFRVLRSVPYSADAPDPTRTPTYTLGAQPEDPDQPCAGRVMGWDQVHGTRLE